MAFASKQFAFSVGRNGPDQNRQVCGKFLGLHYSTHFLQMHVSNLCLLISKAFFKSLGKVVKKGMQQNL